MNREEALSDIVNREHFFWPRRTGPTPRVPGEGWVWVVHALRMELYHVRFGTITREEYDSRKL